ncbi:glycosyltransferase [Pedobacter sp. SYSU D00535]|uniref:glycosyltransferase n=1 Tax=Pedobacter sp. SYSU D00535 TaxID=2810308 RepID=UPI001A95ADE8|nr:glycosyltransferase [Pedobacter sp. SYSU D00535]
MKPKLFFVINTLQGGGAERVVTTLANHFNRKGYRVFIVCLNYAPASYIPDAGVEVLFLVRRDKSHHIVNRLLYAFLTFFRLLQLLKKEKPTCVVSFMTSVNLWTGLTCSLLKIPFMVSERTTPDDTIHKLNYFLKHVSFLVYRQSKAVVLPSEGMINCFKKNKSFSTLENFRIIRNPVMTFNSASSNLVYPRKFILAVGRLDPIKGFDLLIEAFAKLKGLDIDLLISGEGTERDFLCRLIERFDLADKVKLIGFKENLQDYYQQAELFVLSSRNEGYPNALIEAMSLGCPCIATDCEFGPSEIIEDGQNGILIPTNNPDAIADAVLNVLTNPILKERISRRARLITRTNSIERISSKWENLILSHV